MAFPFSIISNSDPYRRAVFVVLCVLLYVANRKRLARIRAWFSTQHSQLYLKELLPAPHPVVYPGYWANNQTLWLHMQRWPVSNPKAIVIIGHGYAEHVGRFAGLAKHLNNFGFYCLGYDLQGHGQSEGDRGHVEKFSDYIDDLLEFRARVGSEFPNKPIFLFGHSMGGLIAILAAIRNPEIWNGVVLSSPALHIDPKVDTAMNRFLAKHLANIMPKLGVDSVPSDTLSSWRLSVTRYNRDPLVHKGKMKVCWAHQFTKALKFANDNADKFDVPFLILCGSDDRLTSPQGSEAVFKKSPSTDKKLEILPGMMHEIVNEVPENAMQVLDKIEKWMIARLINVK